MQFVNRILRAGGMNVVGLSAEHESNLRKLAGYLLSGNLRANFDMLDYSEWGSGRPEKVSCGTIGCFAGHGPDAGIEKLAGELWPEYIRRQFGIPRGARGGVWYWCFASNWSTADNTPEGAARRALWMLEYGVPDDWESQMCGDAPLCYQDFEITPDMLDWQAVLHADAADRLAADELASMSGGDEDTVIESVTGGDRIDADFEIVVDDVWNDGPEASEPAASKLMTADRLQDELNLAAELHHSTVGTAEGCYGRQVRLVRLLWGNIETLREKLAASEARVAELEETVKKRGEAVTIGARQINEQFAHIAKLERELKESAERRDEVSAFEERQNARQARRINELERENRQLKESQAARADKPDRLKRILDRIARRFL